MTFVFNVETPVETSKLLDLRLHSFFAIRIYLRNFKNVLGTNPRLRF